MVRGPGDLLKMSATDTFFPSTADTAYSCDPRIKKFKEEEKARKESEKKAKADAKKREQEERERVSLTLNKTLSWRHVCINIVSVLTFQYYVDRD